MKKIIIFFGIVILIICIIGIRYYSYLAQYNITKEENLEYEKYKDKEIYGIDLVTIINKTIDKNIKNGVEKNIEEIFIPNDKNSIEIEIYLTDNEKTYKMETFYNNGIDIFYENYKNIKFKCSKIEYHEKTKKIKYILFEQISG